MVFSTSPSLSSSAADVQLYVTKGEITSEMQKSIRESARTENKAESSPRKAVMELAWAGMKARSCLKCGQMCSLRCEAKARLQENTNPRSVRVLNGSHIKVCSYVKQRLAGVLAK